MLIDAQKLVRRLSAVCMTDDAFGMGVQMGINHAMKIIGETPFEDAEKVVRCRNCTYHGRCEVEDLLVHFDPTVEHYCCHGERRTDED